jgi:hypothetical protein
VNVVEGKTYAHKNFSETEVIVLHLAARPENDEDRFVVFKQRAEQEIYVTELSVFKLWYKGVTK